MLSVNSILSLDQGKLLAHLKSEDAYYAHFAPPEKKVPRTWRFVRFLRWPSLTWRKVQPAE